MAGQFLTEDFLLQTKTARTLYHEHAANMPIYDYHCHLPAQQIAADHRFENLDAGLALRRPLQMAGDADQRRAGEIHHGRRQRLGEIREMGRRPCPPASAIRCITGRTWSCARPFGITGKLLGPDTAKEIYDECSEMLRSPEFSVRNIMRKMNVKLVCTTEGPLDTLEHHRKIRQDGFEIKVHTAWRPDQAMAVEDLPKAQRLHRQARRAVRRRRSPTLPAYIEALRERHDYFHEHGCRLSDHGLETAYAEDYTDSEIEAIFAKIRTGRLAEPSARSCNSSPP